MRIINIIISVFICCISSSCYYEMDDVGLCDNYIHIVEITDGSTLSRADIIKSTIFGSNDTILFNSYGAHENLNRRIFLNGNEWQSSNPLVWNDTSSDSIYYYAIYPAMDNNQYTSNELYQDGKLTDILFCKGKSEYQHKLALQFHHIFSALYIDISNVKASQIEQLTITSPIKVESVDTENGIIHCINDSISTTISIGNEQESGLFYIMPPAESLSLKIELKTTDKNITKYIIPFKCETGKLYKCYIKDVEQTIGIKSGEDLVAFSYLINGYSYQSRKLDEFAHLENGRRVFSLLNDITLSSAESSKLKVIGSSSRNFNDVFDGRGHVIKNLSIDVKSKNGVGLFGYVGQEGIIRNLRISDSKLTISQDGTQTGMIAFRNEGVIDHCYISNCSIKVLDNCSIGLLTHGSFGTIINCGTYNNSITNAGSSSYVSYLVYNANGKIVNCFTANNSISQSKGTMCGICFNSNTTLEASNCYVKFGTNSSSYYHFCYLGTTAMTFKNCFKGSGTKAPDTAPNIIGCYTYGSNYTISTNGKKMVDMLNEWIDNNQKLYPEIELKRWKSDSLVPAIHIE